MQTNPLACANPYPLRVKIGRVIWSVMWTLLFRPTPRKLGNPWRKILLRLFGAKIGKTAWIHPSVRIAVPWQLRVGEATYIDSGTHLYNHHGVEIGDRCTLSANVFLCTTSHDHTDPTMPVIGSPITVANDVWLCADVFVAPGVRIGHGAVAGARAAVFKDVAPWTVVGGNPARFIKQRILQESRK